VFGIPLVVEQIYISLIIIILILLTIKCEGQYHEKLFSFAGKLVSI